MIRCMKSLGPLVRLPSGLVSANYEIVDYRGDLDIDSERELKSAVVERIVAATNTDGMLDEMQTVRLRGRSFQIMFYISDGRTPTTGMSRQ